MHIRQMAIRSIPLLLTCSFLGVDAAAQTPLDTVRIISGTSRPLWAGTAPGDTRIFVVEQNTSDIEIFTATGAPIGKFLDLTGKVKTSANEEGLLSMAFHPDYQNNGFFFVYYTATGVGSRIERYKVSGNPDVADATSGVTVLEQSQPFSNHNGGELAFGPDGYLYMSYGDGGSANDPFCNAQKLDILLGKMIRIDVDSLPYSIPPGNPYIGVAGALPEIWFTGLRNPFRWSFDADTGDIYIGDVGQDQREEVDYAPAGASALNYGWKVEEGDICGGLGSCPGGTPGCGDSGYTAPIHTYNHSGFGGICTVIGGVVYRGCAIPDLDGTYFFADYCSDEIWSFEYDTIGGVQNFTDRTTELAPGGGLSITSIVHFGEDANGEILIIDQNGGEIFKVVAGAVNLTDPTPGIVGGPNSVTFSGASLGDMLAMGYSLSAGSTPIGAPCAGLSVDLANPTLVGILTADACGTATFAGSVPVSFGGTTIFMQGVDIDTCQKTNLVQYTFP